MSVPDDPLKTLNDDELWNVHLLINILCNRRTFNQRKPRASALCGLGHALQIEADLRGVPTPDHPYTLGKWRDLA